MVANYRIITIDIGVPCKNPILDTRIFVLCLDFVRLHAHTTALDSETGRTGELWSKKESPQLAKLRETFWFFDRKKRNFFQILEKKIIFLDFFIFSYISKFFWCFFFIDFWIFLGFLYDFFLDSLDFLLTLFELFWFLEFFFDFFFYFILLIFFFFFFLQLLWWLRGLLNTINKQKQHKQLLFCSKGKKSIGRNPPQELKESLRSSQRAVPSSSIQRTTIKKL